MSLSTRGAAVRRWAERLPLLVMGLCAAGAVAIVAHEAWVWRWCR